MLLPSTDTQAAVQVVNLSNIAYDLQGGADLGRAKAVQVLSSPTIAMSINTKYLTHLKPVIESLPSDMTPAERSGATMLIEAYEDAFSRRV